MTDCNGCGSCCNPVVLPYTPIAAALDYSLDARTRRWVTDELTPMKHREVREHEPWLLSSYNLSFTPDGGEVVVPYFYSCKWFDESSRRCTNWHDRPQPCRDYPWDGIGGPDPRVALPPTCSFRADIGLPVEIRAR